MILPADDTPAPNAAYSPYVCPKCGFAFSSTWSPAAAAMLAANHARRCTGPAESKVQAGLVNLFNRAPSKSNVPIVEPRGAPHNFGEYLRRKGGKGRIP